MANRPKIDYDILKSRCAIVTGGASGLGEATVTRFAEHGAYVTIADMQDEMGQALAKKLTDQGHKVTFVHCDTTDWDSQVSTFKHAINFSPSKTLDIAVLFAGTDGERKGLVDLVLQNAGEPSLTQDPGRPAHRAVDVNLIGVYLSTYLSLHYFRLPGTTNASSAPTKSLVFISSITGYIDLPYNTGYAVSKYAIRGLFRSIRPHAHKINVRTNNIVPAYVLTPLTQKVHGITDPSQPSMATGTVMPWAPIEFVTEAVSMCAVDEKVDGRSWAIVPSGVIDMQEDFESGYGGAKTVELLENDGFTKIASMFPKKA